MKPKKPCKKPTLRKLTIKQIEKFTKNLPEGVSFVAKKCNAIIWHGPGHQSATKCQLETPHKIHMAVYGSAEQLGKWKGKKAFSGFFDEPPPLRTK